MPANDRPAPLFGLNIDPSAANLELAFRLAATADEIGLDLIGIQDHPNIDRFLDTWTLLSTLGARTERVRLLPNVLNLPLRPPAVLAKAAASLDLITGGRVELGLGAGGFWDGIAGLGGPRRAPGDAVDALEEAIQVFRSLWQPVGSPPVSVIGAHYQLAAAKPGPAPAHPIGIWLGALGPRMLRLTGQLADGWSVSNTYVAPERLPEMGAAIDRAAEASGRAPAAIRRLYNLMGMILPAEGSPVTSGRRGALVGTADEWVEQIVRFGELGMDTFIYWPVAGDEVEQARVFANEVVPAVRARLAGTN